MGLHRFNRNTRRFADVVHAPCIYVAELSTGVLKVGASGSARARMMSLANEVKREHGAEIERFHIVPRATFKAAYETETRLIDLLMDKGAEVVPGRREFFRGTTFKAAKALCKRACATLHLPRQCGRERLQGGRRAAPPIGAYLEDLRAGLTLGQIAKKHGKADGSVVYGVLKRRGLPTKRSAIFAAVPA